MDQNIKLYLGGTIMDFWCGVMISVSIWMVGVFIDVTLNKILQELKKINWRS